MVTSSKRRLKMDDSWLVFLYSFFFYMHTKLYMMWIKYLSNFSGLKKDFKMTFFRRSLGREVLLCVQSCKALREVEQCSTVLVRKPSRWTACNKIHLILFLCVAISFQVVLNIPSGLTFPSVMQWNHSGWLRPALLHWDILQGKWRICKQSTESLRKI